MASTTTRQTAAARKKAAAKPTSDVLDFEPLRIAANEDFVEERVTLFYMGDDEYTIPKAVPPGVALEYLKETREYGRDVAAATLLTTVLGEEAFAALARSKALTNEQMEWIINKVLDLGLGREKKGKAR